MALVRDTRQQADWIEIDRTCALCGERDSVVHWHGFARGVDEGDLAMCVPCARSVCVGLLVDLVLNRMATFAEIVGDIRETVLKVVGLRKSRGMAHPEYDVAVREIEGE